MISNLTSEYRVEAEISALLTTTFPTAPAF